MERLTRPTYRHTTRAFCGYLRISTNRVQDCRRARKHHPGREREGIKKPLYHGAQACVSSYHCFSYRQGYQEAEANGLTMRDLSEPHSRLQSMRGGVAEVQHVPGPSVLLVGMYCLGLQAHASLHSLLHDPAGTLSYVQAIRSEVFQQVRPIQQAILDDLPQPGSVFIGGKRS